MLFYSDHDDQLNCEIPAMDLLLFNLAEAFDNVPTAEQLVDMPWEIFFPMLGDADELMEAIYLFCYEFKIVINDTQFDKIWNKLEARVDSHDFETVLEDDYDKYTLESIKEYWNE